ncbi:hypothetical protein EX30DRAFT_137608 [Ascodesmis nigricans]|uniref:RNase III domain-containing protein n=1 Tax=Ascodesmis nigricans TaxID=341454 RepID=A0A4S2N0W4_9PEZI|nr:hypothetical protein EX30DRAFT_137608 [Ascodesmis nigricans]
MMLSRGVGGDADLRWGSLHRVLSRVNFSNLNHLVDCFALRRPPPTDLGFPAHNSRTMASRVVRPVSSVLSALEAPRRPITDGARRAAVQLSLRRCLHDAGAATESAPSATAAPSIPHAIARKKDPRPESERPHYDRPRAPYPMKNRTQFAVNEDIKKLNSVIDRLVGPDHGLPDDLKWQIVTHKSFDHGRQPFNQKLAHFGRIVLQLHTAQAILEKPSKERTPKPTTYKGINGDIFAAPEPFVHEDYKNLLGVKGGSVADPGRKQFLSEIIFNSGLLDVTRWKPAEVSVVEVCFIAIADNTQMGSVPRMSANLGVGRESLLALIGALALHKGGDVAEKFVTQKILPNLTKVAPSKSS